MNLQNVKVAVGIPVRMNSSRFPGKPLCLIDGKTMLSRVYSACKSSELATDVFIAGCDSEVEEVALLGEMRYLATEPKIDRPSVRVAHAAQSLNLSSRDIVVVVQGDEPLIRGEMIDDTIKSLMANPEIEITNMCAVVTQKEMMDAAEIKVVVDLNMYAMYMSRAPIPPVAHESENSISGLKQVCVFGFRWESLQRLAFELSPSPLEQRESIEMNRVLEHGMKIKMIKSIFDTKSVDTESDRLEVERLIQSHSQPGRNQSSI